MEEDRIARRMPLRCHARLSRLCSRTRQRKCNLICCWGERTQFRGARRSRPVRSNNMLLMYIHTLSAAKMFRKTNFSGPPRRPRRLRVNRNSANFRRRSIVTLSPPGFVFASLIAGLDPHRQAHRLSDAGCSGLGPRIGEDLPRFLIVSEKSPRKFAPRKIPSLWALSQDR